MTKSLLLAGLLLALLNSSLGLENNHRIILKHVEEFMRDPRSDQTKMGALLESGSMNGFFTTEEVELIFSNLADDYKDVVSSRIIGQTVQRQDIHAYFLREVTSGENSSTKSKVLFTGGHHPRELLTANMIVKIFLETLHSLIHESGKLNFWHFCDLIIVPIVNMDGHRFISTAWGTEHWSSHSMKRKNMNSDYCG